MVVPGFPSNLYTKLTETLRQIKTTFPMNIIVTHCDNQVLREQGKKVRRREGGQEEQGGVGEGGRGEGVAYY